MDLVQRFQSKVFSVIEVKHHHKFVTSQVRAFELIYKVQLLAGTGVVQIKNRKKNLKIEIGKN